MIEQIKEELEKATPGPWKYQTGFYGSNHLVYEIETDNLVCTAKTHFKTEENMKLIANTPTYIRYFLDELEKAQKKSVEWENEARLQYKLFNEMIEKERDVRQQLQKVHAEHTAMKEALGWYAQFEDRPYYNDNGSRARTVLTTLAKEDIENE